MSSELEFEQAAERVSFQLSYQRSPKRREFTIMELTGPMIDDAFNEDRMSVGSWCVDYCPSIDTKTVDEWLQEFFATACTEALHEVCEWFRIDDEIALNPHDAAVENRIVELTAALGRELWQLRRTRLGQSA